MIPNIIHQIWEGASEPLPEFLKELGSTWKDNHPSWSYEFWDKDRMNSFVEDNYPDFLETYLSYPYPVQRWDAIRYLILYKMGGLYVDFDYESIESVEKILTNKSCCFALEPNEHSLFFNKEYIISNAFMACGPYHPFFKEIIQSLFINKHYNSNDKFKVVMNTTGPFMLCRVYDEYINPNDVYLISSELVSPFTKYEVIEFIKGYDNSTILNLKLKDAIAIHYYFGTWL